MFKYTLWMFVVFYIIYRIIYTHLQSIIFGSYQFLRSEIGGVIKKDPRTELKLLISVDIC